MKKTYILLLSFIVLLLVNDANAQLKLGDQPTSVQKSVILDLQGSNGRQGVWLPRISDTSDVTGIDALNPPDGVMMYHTPSEQVMIRRNGSWSSLQTTTKVGSTTSSQSIIEFQLGTAPGALKDFNMTLNNTSGVITLNVPDAAVDTRGVVTISSQSFGGLKTFNDGLTSLSTTTISGASSNASNLYLGITSATTPGTTTDRFLSVDNTGRVVLSQGIPSTRSLTINGTTYDLSANRTWSVGTVTSVANGYGLSGGTITTTGTLAVDTFSVATRNWRQKGIDSIASIVSGAYVPLTRTLNGLALSSNQTFATGTSGTDFGISSSGTTHTFNIPTSSATNRGLLSSADWTTFNNKLSTSRTLTINGTTYDLSANRTWSVGTVTSVANGYGLSGGTITTTGTLAVDTFSVSTRNWRQKGIDSIASIVSGAYVPLTRTLNGLALSSNQTFATGTSGTDFGISSSGTTHTFNIPTSSATNRGLLSSTDWTTFNNKLSTSRTLTINGTTYDLSANRTWSVGTVTSVANGYGLSGGTITTTGTLAVDTFSVSTRNWRQKGIDSIASIVSGAYVPLTRTLNGLALSSNQTFATGTSGTDFGISSSGTTHTFNIPTASATNRGLLSTADWTTFNNKVSDTRTINGLALSFNHTFSTGSSGTDFNIVSGGSTHTFNIPTASATNRGLLSSTDWTTFNNKLSSTRTLTINGTTYDLSANRTWSVGTVTSVANGYGLSGGTITTTGTLAVDTFSVATRNWRQKGIDSIASIVSGAYVPLTRTLNGLALSSNQTFATGTSGTDFGISSSGTTHTFNIPDASATARGVVTTGSQTIAGLKTFSTGVTVSGATSYTSNLRLGITSATTPASSTDRYLTVDASGNVYLSSVTGITGLTTIGASPNANGATISGGLLSLQPASLSFGGIVTTGTQTFEGNKTFDNTVSAKINLQAGTATAGTAPLKFTSGTNLTTAENGAVEYDGTNYYATSGGTRYTLARTLTATATLDFPSTDGAGGTSSLNITVTGAATGDVVTLGIPPSAITSGGTYHAYVSAANTVTIVFTNSLVAFFGIGIAADPGSGTFRVSVLKY